MSTVVGQWRASYTPGDWVLLSGPTSLVLLEPPPPERASMIEVLWEEVLATSSMTDLAGRLAAYPLDSLPSFAAFFWTADGMRSLVRGAVSVVDLSSGTTVADGEGVQTWSEVGLGQVTQVLVDVQSGNGTRLELPLVVGAVRASSVRLDASEAARVRSPQAPIAAAVSPERSDGSGHDEAVLPYAEQAPGYAEDGAAYAAEDGAAYAAGAEDDTGDTEEQDQVEATDSESGADAAWAGLAGIAPGAAATELPLGREPVAELPGPATELLADPFADDPGPEEWRPEEWRPEEWPAEAWNPEAGPDPYAAAPSPEPFSPATGPEEEGEGDQIPDRADADIAYPMWQPDAEPVPARALPSDGPGDLENADTALMPPPNSAPLTGMGVSQDSLIMAVVCQYGHASAQNATTCRICGSPIAPQGPQLLPRPVLAVLRSSDGSTAEVDRAVLVGRAPSAQRSSARSPKLMTVPSPGHDISRTHLEVAPEGWTIVVTDLHSTNGTTLVRPGGVDRQALPAGETVPVELGSVVELGDGISVLIDFPQ
ncbi:MAG TPA: FHA domain-containing protein [Propionibacteriaceae bacterium]|nr:FHA domain-containing protein [Propionibacteriaceae bacterium]